MFCEEQRCRFTESRVNNYTGFGRTPLCYSTNDRVHNYMFWEEAENSRAKLEKTWLNLVLYENPSFGDRFVVQWIFFSSSSHRILDRRRDFLQSCPLSGPPSCGFPNCHHSNCHPLIR